MTATSGSGGDSVHFLTESGNMVMTAPGSKEAIKESYRSTIQSSQSFKQILVTGVDKNDQLKAWYSEKQNDSTENRILAGQVNIVAYDKITEELCLVEVNGAIAPEADFVEKELNMIYSSSIVQWKVSKVSGIKTTLDNYNNVFDNVHDEMKYTSHEKQVKDAFMNTKDYNKNKCYLFFIKGETKKDIKGFMPYNRQFGFIYTSNVQAADVMHTLAHELGHGLFRLEHPYKVDDPKMLTEDNLMAYNQSTHIFKSHWDEMRKFHLGINWLEDGEEAEAIDGYIGCYFSINSDSLQISNQILNVTESNRDFNIKFLYKNNSINLDSIYLLVNTDTIKNTNVTKKFLNNMHIIAKKTGSSDTLSFLDIRVDKDSLYAKFTTKSSYKGEFGFDDGMDFSSTSVPKANMVYDTIHNSDGDVLYSPFITMDPNTTITINASIINKMPEYNYFAESSSPAIICLYDTTTSDLKITNSNYTNTFNSPDHIFIYRIAKNNIEPKQMIGKCEVFSMNKDSVNVYILYYKHDTVPFTNIVVPSDLDDKLNKYSLNQSFKGFNVDHNIYSIIDSTVIDSIHLSTKRSAYNRILRTLMLDKVSNPGKYKSNSFYVIMSDLVFPVTGTPGAYSGGGVLSNSAYAIMWEVPFLTPADFPELIAHEGGHVFQLFDTFNDPTLGNPAQNFSRHNYMDYFITRYMFFKTQIKTMYNLKSTKE